MSEQVYKLARTWRNHPVFVSALGMAPLAAKSATLLSALTIVATAAGVLLLSSLSVSMLRRAIPHAYRLAYILIITATWASVFDLLLQAFLYEIRMSLEIYIPLIAMNSLLLMLLEDGALQLSVPACVKGSLAASAVLFLVLVPTGFVREVLTQGALLTDAYLLFPSASERPVPMFPESAGLALFDSAAGALLVLGCMLALINLLPRTDETPTAAPERLPNGKP